MEKNEIKAKIIGIMSNLFQNSDVDTDVLEYVGYRKRRMLS